MPPQPMVGGARLEPDTDLALLFLGLISGKGKAMTAIEIIDDMEEKLDKFLIAQSEASKGRSDMVEVQQCMSAEKLETAKEKKEVKMLDLYKGLLMHDTRGMPDDMKVEHMKALRSMREKLFGPSD